MIRSLLVLTCLALATPLAAQKLKPIDVDDEPVGSVEIKKGRKWRKIKGRVWSRHEREVLRFKDEKGKNLELEEGEWRNLIAVRDTVAEVLKARRDATDSDGLVAAAATAYGNGLPHMARLLCYEILTKEPDHDVAHTLLGHKKRNKDWLWIYDKKGMKADRWHKHVGDFGHPLEIRSTHFVIRTDAGIAKAVEVLFDLEALYQFWFETFSKYLELKEILEPAPILIRKDRDSYRDPFATGRAYYEGQIQAAFKRDHHGAAYSYYETQDRRPKALFEVGTQMVLHHTTLPVKGQPVWLAMADRDSPIVFAPWIEHGIGHWFSCCAGGEPGKVTFGKPKVDKNELVRLLRAQGSDEKWRDDLKKMVARPNRDFYGKTSYVDVFWAQARLFTYYCMEAHRPELVKFLRGGFIDAEGSSTTLFKRAFEGKADRIEDLLKPWLAWLKNQ